MVTKPRPKSTHNWLDLKLPLHLSWRSPILICVSWISSFSSQLPPPKALLLAICNYWSHHATFVSNFPAMPMSLHASSLLSYSFFYITCICPSGTITYFVLTESIWSLLFPSYLPLLGTTSSICKLYLLCHRP